MAHAAGYRRAMVQRVLAAVAGLTAVLALAARGGGATVTQSGIARRSPRRRRRPSPLRKTTKRVDHCRGAALRECPVVDHVP